MWLLEIADRPYPQVMHEIPAWDAYLIYQVAYVLNEQIRAADPDLAFMYTYGEVPLVTILLDMTRHGIGVDGAKAAVLCRSPKLTHLCSPKLTHPFECSQN